MSKRTKKFKTEVQQLLHLVVHSLYSKKEIFLRELISNASDAIDRARFEALTQPALQRGDDEWKIKLIPDAAAGTLTLSDNGVGMTLEEVEADIGTIANSGTKAFMESLQSGAADNPEFIGQFGVGFYSAFMVADRVVVETRRQGSDAEAIRWVSEGTGSYTVETIEKEHSGTDIILHLREDQKSFLEEWTLRRVVKEYSDYISFPVVMDVTRKEKKDPDNEESDEEIEVTKEETLNSRKAIWRKKKADISEEEYHEFYKHVSHDYTEPLEVIHYQAEGTTEFQALLFIPAQPPFDLFMQKDGFGPQLYVKNVQIMDHCKELLPEYLRFIKGVVDSSDLPLNVSREQLQDDVVIRRIRKSLVNRILGSLKDMKDKRPDDYRKFFTAFGRILKEGVHFDFENKDKILELLLFHTTATKGQEPITLTDYRDRMSEDQQDIYYLSGENLEVLRSSPYLEAFTEKGYEVILLNEPIDEWVVQAVTEFKEKKLKAIDRGDLDLDGESQEKEEKGGESEGLLKAMQDRFSEELSAVRMSRRLKTSACCLVNEEHGMNPNMERIMRAMNQDVPPTKKILELNPDHPLIARLNALQEAGEEETVHNFMDLLYGQALLNAGADLKDPARFTRLVSDLMAKS